MASEKNIEELENRISVLEKEKKQLLKLISHDVKSPFNKLFALSNLLQMVSEDLNEEQLDYLGRMEWVIKEGLTVVKNLMDLRAIENNAIELNPESLQLDVILNDCLKNYSKQSDVKELKINSLINKVTIQSDKRSIEKIVDNLISNAVKFSPLKSVVLIHLSKDERKVTLDVITQSGPISEEELSSLFKKNVPLSTRPTYGESALGNGLFIAQNYAKALSANIEFNQKGSEISFKFEVPVELLTN